MSLKEDKRLEFRLSSETKKRLAILAKIETQGNRSEYIRTLVNKEWEKIK